MKAIKDNKVYTVDEISKTEYLAKGYDIFDNAGNCIERSPSSTVSRREHDELLDKYNKLIAENKKLKDKVKGNVHES